MAFSQIPLEYNSKGIAIKIFATTYICTYVKDHELIFTYVVLAVLKKNYTKLCQCLPHDYTSTINKMKQLIRIPKEVLSYWDKMPAADIVNEAIIYYMLIGIKSDKEALIFCKLMAKLTDNSAVKAVRNGKSLLATICMQLQ